MSLLTKIFGDPDEKILKKFQPLVEQINFLEKEFENLGQQELKAKTDYLKSCLNQGKTKDEILPQAFAAVREAAKRTLKQRHYDVQLLGGIILHQGKIAEMRTGEGKTLASTCPIYLNALDGKGVHVVTVNDYLSKRDCVWMGQIYNALGLSVGCLVHEIAYLYDPTYVNSEQKKEHGDQDSQRDKNRDILGNFKIEDSYLRPVSRQQAYQADITYGTNNEFGFDYLRDNLVSDIQEKSQRELNFAIIDEIDSILIDEARTPLIISAPAEESASLYHQLARLSDNLKTGQDYLVDEKMRAVTLTEDGMNKMASLLGEDPWEKSNLDLIHHIEAALKAKTLFQKNRDYVVKEGEIVIVDEFTGRLMIGRRYSEGIHQAIEAKENVSVRQESKTLATITFQNYFRFYKKIAGMTGTAITEAEEFDKIYNLDVVLVPTNEPLIRKDLPDRIYQNHEAKLEAIVREVKERHEKGQPILIGTGGFTIGEKTVGAIEKNRIIREALEKQGIEASVLDATNHEKEGQIIAQAGGFGAVTVATNMAGRGVDIILGGNPPDKEKQEKILSLGGLHIIGTERHESRRIDNQLRGRAGRQGDPGSSQFFISLDDDLMRIFGGAKLGSLMQTLNLPKDIPIESRAVSRAIESAQKKVEGFNFDTRKHLLEYDDVLNRHREAVYQRRKKILILPYQDIKKEIIDLTIKEIQKLVGFYTSSESKNDWDFEKLSENIKAIFDTKDDLKEILSQQKDRLAIIDYLEKLAQQAYQNLEEKIEKTQQQIELGVTDSLIARICRSIMLKSIDQYWIFHLEIINNLKGGIGLRAYGQQDPLVEYKKESRKKFGELMDSIDRQVVYSIYKVGLVEKAPQLKKEIQFQGAQKISQPNQASFRPKGEKKIGRNDSCPCGSGKKYKKCCGSNIS